MRSRGYPQSTEHLYLNGLGASRASRKAPGRRVCASDVLPTAWLRVQPCMEYTEEGQGPVITGSADAAATFRSTIPVDARGQEYFLVMLLDAKNRVTGIDMVGAGGVDSAVVDLRLVFQAAIMVLASAIIIAHNHPSGEATPSPEDIEITDRIVKASKILNIRVLDHVVLGRDANFSFLDAGMLPV